MIIEKINKRCHFFVVFCNSFFLTSSYLIQNKNKKNLKTVYQGTKMITIRSNVSNVNEHEVHKLRFANLQHWKERFGQNRTK